MTSAPSTSRVLAWWQLLRAANVFTAVSNVIAGFLIVQGNWEPALPLALLIAASACTYLAGMVLNDVFDAQLDAVERPERPIPSGRISRSVASWAGGVLLTIGVALACAAAWSSGRGTPILIGCTLAIVVVLYDSGLKSTRFGPAAMGWCRILNVILGASVAENLAAETAAWMYALAVGAYTIALTYVARSETVGAAARMLRVRNVVTRLLQGFIVMDAIAVTFAAGWPSGLAVLALLIPTLIASRWAAMT